MVTQPKVESLAHEAEQVLRNRNMVREVEARVSPRGDHAALHVRADGSRFNEIASTASRYDFTFVEKFAEDGYLFRHAGGGL